MFNIGFAGFEAVCSLFMIPKQHCIVSLILQPIKQVGALTATGSNKNLSCP